MWLLSSTFSRQTYLIRRFWFLSWINANLCVELKSAYKTLASDNLVIFRWDHLYFVQYWKCGKDTVRVFTLFFFTWIIKNHIRLQLALTPQSTSTSSYSSYSSKTSWKEISINLETILCFYYILNPRWFWVLDMDILSAFVKGKGVERKTQNCIFIICNISHLIVNNNKLCKRVKWGRRWR